MLKKTQLITEATQVRVPIRILSIVTLGILLCPLNSSMISVAITKISGNFEVNLPTTTWLISGFYIGTVVCQPLMGRLADLFGPRRIFCAGMILVFISGSIAPFVPSFSLVFD